MLLKIDHLSIKLLECVYYLLFYVYLNVLSIINLYLQKSNKINNNCANFFSIC